MISDGRGLGGRVSRWRRGSGCLLALAVLCVRGAATAAAEVKVTDFGAVPNDGKDDTPALRAAIEACRKEPGARLVFAPGRYDLPAGAYRQPRLTLEGMENLTLDGNGAELVGSGLTTLFVGANCRNLTIRNLVIDWDPLPFSSGKVVAAEGKQFDLEVVPPHTAQAGLRVEGVLGYDPERRRLAIRGFDHYQLGFRERTELVRPGVMRVPVSGEGGRPPVGGRVIVRHQTYAYNGFTFQRCANVTLENITLYCVPGMGLYAAESRDLTLRHFDVLLRPGSGRWMSATADATHFNNCRGTITLEDCQFEGMGDDAANLHSMYLVVAEKVDARTVKLVQGRGRGLPPIPQAGDRLEFGGGENPLAPYATATVASAAADAEGKTAVVRFTEALPERAAAGDVVGNSSTCAAARIRRCRVIRNRARGMLIQTRDVVVEDCTFEDISGAALHIASDCNYWWEGMGTRRVTIRNNRFARCDFGTARRNSVIDLFAEVGPKLAGPGVHREVLIEGNTIEDADGAAVHVGCADGVTLRNNRFVRPTDAAVIIQNSRNVTLAGNKLEGGKAGVRVEGGCDPATIHVEGNEGFGG